MAKSTLRLTHQEAVIKVYGASGVTETIDISTLLATGQVLDGSTQAANIIGLTWTGAADGIITISRNAVTIATLQANAAGMIYFDGQSMPPDSIQNTQDLSVAITGAACECWIKLRKISGYKTTIEPEQFGSHDNPLVAGS